jgi:hypothetical protein
VSEICVDIIESKKNAKIYHIFLRNRSTLTKVGFNGQIADGFGGGVSGDFLKGKEMSEEVSGQALATSDVVGGDGVFTVGQY